MSGIIAVIPYFSEFKIAFYGINLSTLETKYNEITMSPDQVVAETFQSFKKCGFGELEAFLYIFKDGDLEQRSALAATFGETFHSMNIPFYCCTWRSIIISATMMACVNEHGNDVIKEKETEYIFCRESDYTNYNIIKHDNYYRINYIYNNQSSHFKNVVEVLTASKFVVTCFTENHQDVVTMKQKQTQKLITDHLAGKTVITLTKNISSYISKAIAAKTMKLYKENPSKYDVANTGFKDFGIGTAETAHFMMMNFRPQKEYMKKFLIKIASNEIVPVRKTFVNFEKFENLVIFESGSNGGFVGYARIDLPEFALAVTLSVDQYFKQDIDIRELKELPKGNKIVDNVAMMCIKDDAFSVATIKNAKFNKIVFNNVPIAIGFVDDKIQIGHDAMKLKESHNSFVITDLIKILKTSPSDLKADQKWGFEIIKDDNGSTLLEFDTFRGRRRATPTFLFAFFIRYAVKTIEVISGQMPKTIVLVSKNLNDDYREQLKESCKSAKVNINNVQIHEYKIVEINE